MKKTRSKSDYEDMNNEGLLLSFLRVVNNTFSKDKYQKLGDEKLYETSNENFDEIQQELKQFKTLNLTEIQKANVDLAISLVDSIRTQTNNNFFNPSVTLEDRMNLVNGIASAYSSFSHYHNKMNHGNFRGITEGYITRQSENLKEFNKTLNLFMKTNNLELNEEAQNNQVKIDELQAKIDAKIQEELEKERIKQEEFRIFREEQKEKRMAYVSELDESFKGKTNSFGDIFKQDISDSLDKYEVSALIKNHKFDPLSLSEIPIDRLDVMNDALKLSYFTFPNNLEAKKMFEAIEEKRKDYNSNKNYQFQLNELVVTFEEPTEEATNEFIEDFIKSKQESIINNKPIIKKGNALL